MQRDATEQAITMTWSHVARRTAVWLVAALLWLYAGLGLILGLFILSFFAPLGLPFILGSSLVAAGTLYTRRRRHVLAGVLFIAGASSSAESSAYCLDCLRTHTRWSPWSPPASSSDGPQFSSALP